MRAARARRSPPPTADAPGAATARATAAVWALAAALFALGVAVALRALTEDVRPDTAVVPTVVGLTRTTAESRIRAAGFVAQVERGASRRPQGVVVRQQPEPGAVLSRGSVVGITLSRGRAPR